MFEPPVKPERSGWRDLKLNERHRQWGFNVPATDIDLFLEYDNCEPAAIVEYKNERAKPCLPTDKNRKALVRLADRAKVPLFGVRYAADFSWLNVVPLNSLAKKHVGRNGQMMNERGYVAFMYRIRGRVMPPGVIGNGEF